MVHDELRPLVELIECDYFHTVDRLPKPLKCFPPGARVTLNLRETSDYEDALRLHRIDPLLFQSVSIFICPRARSIPFVSVGLNLHQRIGEFLRQTPCAAPDFLLSSQQRSLGSFDFHQNGKSYFAARDA